MEEFQGDWGARPGQSEAFFPDFADTEEYMDVVDLVDDRPGKDEHSSLILKMIIMNKMVMKMDDGHGSLGGHSARPWHCVLREDCVDGDELLDEVENGGWCFTCILFERYPLTNIPHCGR